MHSPEEIANVLAGLRADSVLLLHYPPLQGDGQLTAQQLVAADAGFNGAFHKAFPDYHYAEGQSRALDNGVEYSVKLCGQYEGKQIAVPFRFVHTFAEGKIVQTDIHVTAEEVQTLLTIARAAAAPKTGA
jgi:hypothetical protein